MFDENKHPRDDQGKFTEKYKQNATAKEILSSSKKDKISSPYPFVKEDNGEEFKQALLDAKDHYIPAIRSVKRLVDIHEGGALLFRHDNLVFRLSIAACGVRTSVNVKVLRDGNHAVGRHRKANYGENRQNKTEKFFHG